MIVVADCGPINYLVLSRNIDLLLPLYGAVVIPEAVNEELSNSAAPAEVRAWIDEPPAWVSFRASKTQTGFQQLGHGEREALRLALELHADLVLIDETLARRIATEHGLRVRGSLGVLEAAVSLNPDFGEALQRLVATSIYLDEKTIAAAVERDRIRREQAFTRKRSSERNSG